MAGSRKSTPARARSTSVASNASEATTASKAAKSPRSPKSPKATPKAASKATSTPKSPAPSKAAAKKDAVASPATPRKSTKAASAAETPSGKLSDAQKAAASKRPALPPKQNTELPDEDVPVKLQIIVREGESIIIGRVKLPCPPVTDKGPHHGFLLKRFDTGGVAASSMYRLAFPLASEAAEQAEMEYLESRYDVVAANGGMEKVPTKRPRGRPSKKTLEDGAFTERLPPGSTGVRLQGIWIPSADAVELAKEYGLERYARPLIEAKAKVTPEGVPILTPAAHDKVSTPISGRSKKMLKETMDGLQETLSPSASRKRVKEDGGRGSDGEKGILHTGLTKEQIEKQIKEGQDLVKNVIANGVQAVNGTPPASSRKRRAVNQSPSARVNQHSDEDDYETGTGNAVARSFRRGARAARRRPIATTAGALGAVGAVGAGTLAWLAGGNLDVASQLLQQGVQNLGTWFSF